MLSLKHRVLSLSAKSSDFNDDFRRIGEHSGKPTIWRPFRTRRVGRQFQGLKPGLSSIARSGHNIPNHPYLRAIIPGLQAPKAFIVPRPTASAFRVNAVADCVSQFWLACIDAFAIDDRSLRFRLIQFVDPILHPRLAFLLEVIPDCKLLLGKQGLDLV
jgi:hypothetical protein